jgi:hypothetical protein
MSVPFSPQFEKRPNRYMPATRVRTNRLVPTQLDYKVEQIRKIAAQDPRDIDADPIVHPHQGEYVVGDGHHRVAAAMVRGDTTVRVRRAPPQQADVVDPDREHLGARCYIAESKAATMAPVASHVPPAERHAGAWRRLMWPESMIDNVVGPLTWPGDVGGS